MKATSEQLKALGILRPTLLLDLTQLQRNIAAMADKAKRAGVFLRPHFKTHQSAQVGELFRAAGVTAITVSSMMMAAYFIDHGWQDVTVAIPFNPGELALASQLAARSRLNLLVESPAVVTTLAAGLAEDVVLWIEVDTGYGRTGLSYDQPEAILALARQIAAAPHCHFAGLLMHNGETYRARSQEEIVVSHTRALARVDAVKVYLLDHDITQCDISIGDTPAAGVVTSFPGVTELRPGNFAFYDLMQVQIGACRPDEIALAVACPIIGIYPARGQVAIHGGAVHFSKERLEVENQVVYGYATTLRQASFGPAISEVALASISQEHGIVQMPPEHLEQLRLGDLLLVLPVHSCLTANLFAAYLTLEGKRLPLMPKDYQAT